MNIEILTDEGYSPFHGIRRKKINECVKLYFHDGSHIISTYDHRFFKSHVVVFARDLLVGDILDPNKKIVKIEHDTTERFVYDVLETNNNKFITNLIRN